MREHPENEHLDEGTIHAWIDGGLPLNEAARVESCVTECAACAALVADARGLVAASARILAVLDDVPAGVIPNATATTIESIKAAAARQDMEERHVVFAAAASALPQTREYRQPAGSRSFAKRYGPIAAVLACVAVGLSALQWWVPAGGGDSAKEQTVAMKSPSASAATQPAHGPSASDEAVRPSPSPIASAVAPASPPARIASPEALSNVIVAPRGAESLKVQENEKKKADDEGALRRELTQRTASGGARAGATSGAGAGVAGRITSAPAMPVILADSSTLLGSTKQLAAADKVADRKDVAANTSAAKSITDVRPAENTPAQSRQRSLLNPVVVTGRVTDSASGRPVPAALVYVRGTDMKTETNANGEYQLRVPEGSHVITASVTGYALRSTFVDATGNAIVASFPLRVAQQAQSAAVLDTSALRERDGFAAPPRIVDGLTYKRAAIATESAGNVRRSVYELRPGVDVTLVETRPIARDADKLESQLKARAQQEAPSTPVAAPAPAKPAASGKLQEPVINTVRWTLPDGRIMELSGPISIAELQLLSKRFR